MRKGRRIGVQVQSCGCDGNTGCGRSLDGKDLLRGGLAGEMGGDWAGEEDKGHS